MEFLSSVLLIVHFMSSFCFRCFIDSVPYYIQKYHSCKYKQYDHSPSCWKCIWASTWESGTYHIGNQLRLSLTSAFAPCIHKLLKLMRTWSKKRLLASLDSCTCKFKYVLKRVSFGSKDCTKELKLECTYFLGQTSTLFWYLDKPMGKLINRIPGTQFWYQVY